MNAAEVIWQRSKLFDLIYKTFFSNEDAKTWQCLNELQIYGPSLNEK